MLSGLAPGNCLTITETQIEAVPTGESLVLAASEVVNLSRVLAQLRELVCQALNVLQVYQIVPLAKKVAWKGRKAHQLCMRRFHHLLYSRDANLSCYGSCPG